MASWTPFCKNRRSYEHAIHHGNDVSCPYCGMDNPECDTSYEEYSEPIITATSNEVITVEDSSPPVSKVQAPAGYHSTKQVRLLDSNPLAEPNKRGLNVHTRAPRRCPPGQRIRQRDRSSFLRASPLIYTSIGGLFLM
jgi:hypothetical protein